jgi:hypothetical protein
MAYKLKNNVIINDARELQNIFVNSGIVSIQTSTNIKEGDLLVLDKDLKVCTIGTERSYADFKEKYNLRDFERLYSNYSDPEFNFEDVVYYGGTFGPLDNIPFVINTNGFKSHRSLFAYRYPLSYYDILNRFSDERSFYNQRDFPYGTLNVYPNIIEFGAGITFSSFEYDRGVYPNGWESLDSPANGRREFISFFETEEESSSIYPSDPYFNYSVNGNYRFQNSTPQRLSVGYNPDKTRFYISTAVCDFTTSEHNAAQNAIIIGQAISIDDDPVTGESSSKIGFKEPFYIASYAEGDISSPISTFDEVQILPHPENIPGDFTLLRYRPESSKLNIMASNIIADSGVAWGVDTEIDMNFDYSYAQKGEEEVYLKPVLDGQANTRWASYNTTDYTEDEFYEFIDRYCEPGDWAEDYFEKPSNLSNILNTSGAAFYLRGFSHKQNLGTTQQSVYYNRWHAPNTYPNRGSQFQYDTREGFSINREMNELAPKIFERIELYGVAIRGGREGDGIQFSSINSISINETFKNDASTNFTAENPRSPQEFVFYEFTNPIEIDFSEHDDTNNYADLSYFPIYDVWSNPENSPNAPYPYWVNLDPENRVSPQSATVLFDYYLLFRVVGKKANYDQSGSFRGANNRLGCVVGSDQKLVVFQSKSNSYKTFDISAYSLSDEYNGSISIDNSVYGYIYALNYDKTNDLIAYFTTKGYVGYLKGAIDQQTGEYTLSKTGPLSQRLISEPATLYGWRGSDIMINNTGNVYVYYPALREVPNWYARSELAELVPQGDILTGTLTPKLFNVKVIENFPKVMEVPLRIAQGQDSEIILQAMGYPTRFIKGTYITDLDLFPLNIIGFATSDANYGEFVSIASHGGIVRSFENLAPNRRVYLNVSDYSITQDHNQAIQSFADYKNKIGGLADNILMDELTLGTAIKNDAVIVNLKDNYDG